VSFTHSSIHPRSFHKALKECADEIDLGTQYHLTRYAFLFESIVLSDGSTLVPPPDEGSFDAHFFLWIVVDFRYVTGLGLKGTIETIDNRGDFKTYMQNYAYARGNAPPRGPRREGPSDEGFVCSYIIMWIVLLTCLIVTSITFLQ